MSKDKERARKSEIAVLPDAKKNPDCNCPKAKCERHGFCAPCREYHKKTPPYCERKKVKP